MQIKRCDIALSLYHILFLCFVSLENLLNINITQLTEVNVVITDLDGWLGQFCSVDEDNLSDFAGVEFYCIKKVSVYDVFKETQDHFRVIALQALVLEH